MAKTFLDNLHTILCYKLNCNVDLDKLTEAANKMLDRHLILKSVFFEGKFDGVKTAFGRVKENMTIKIEEYTKDNFEEFVRPFDITKDKLLRIGIIEKSILIIDMNHIITDGFSMNLFATELFKLYNGETLENQAVQYGDFAIHYNNRLKTADFSNEIIYYKKLFGKTNDLTCLPYKSKFKNDIKFILKSKAYQMYKISKMMILKTKPDIKIINVDLSNSVYNLINKSAKRFNLSKAAYFLAIHSLVLACYSKQEDIYTIVIDSNRMTLERENIIGLLLREIPFLINVNNNAKLLDLLRKCSETLLTLYDFNLPPYKILDELKLQKSGVAFKYDPYEMINSKNEKIYNGIELSDVYKYFHKPCPKSEELDFGPYMEYVFTVNEMKDIYKLGFLYDGDLFDEKLIKNIVNMYIDIISNESLLQSNISDLFDKYSVSDDKISASNNIKKNKINKNNKEEILNIKIEI
ncbi:hypothetical protein PIROE2DRAFT_58127 [Piromyces sp. E2]|nr:hypothetical protein PIROE2DRAFT_58127 [Piromyces sp. E2]|eukprot:OUM68361.1 hypothetical protein PIROE2DRAFT_58127 [Piromyces sp. E2]